MTRGDDGVWTATVEPAPAGVWEYSFAVDGLNVLDPGQPRVQNRSASRAKASCMFPRTPPAPWDWQDVPHGTVHGHSYMSEGAGAPGASLLVYTPPGYEREAVKTFSASRPPARLRRQLPDLGRARQSAMDSRQTSSPAGKARPMIVLMLDGHPLGMPGRGDEAKRAAAMDAFQRGAFRGRACRLVESLINRVEKRRRAPCHRGAEHGRAGSR